jgi:hypothetical protein
MGKGFQVGCPVERVAFAPGTLFFNNPLPFSSRSEKAHTYPELPEHSCQLLTHLSFEARDSTSPSLTADADNAPQNGHAWHKCRREDDLPITPTITSQSFGVLPAKCLKLLDRHDARPLSPGRNARIETPPLFITPRRLTGILREPPRRPTNLRPSSSNLRRIDPSRSRYLLPRVSLKSSALLSPKCPGLTKVNRTSSGTGPLALKQTRGLSMTYSRSSMSSGRLRNPGHSQP